MRAAFAEVAASEQMPAAETITVEALESRLKHVESDASLDDSVKKKATEGYQRAAEDLAACKASRARLQEYEQAIASATEEQERLKVELDRTPPPPADSPKKTLAESEHELAAKEAELAKARSRLADLESEPQRRSDRRQEVPKLLEQHRAQLETIARDLASAQVEAQPELANANRWQWLARRQRLQAECEEWEAELRSYDATAALLPLRRDGAARAASQAQQLVETWQRNVSEQRRVDAEDRARSARQSAAQAVPAVKALAERNALLAEQRTGADGLASQIEQVLQTRRHVEQELNDLESAFGDVRRKVELVGLTDAIGALLRKQRKLLPSLRRHEEAVASRRSLIGNVQLRHLELLDERATLADIDAQVDVVRSQIDSGVDTWQREAIESRARELLVARRDTLDALVNDNNSYFAQLLELDAGERRLIDATRRFRDYIDERVLWIRSTRALDFTAIYAARSAAAWFCWSPDWSDLARSARRDVARNPALYLAAVLSFGLMFRTARHLRRRLREAGELVCKSHATAFRPTLTSLAVTCLIALPWPALLGCLAYRLEYSPEATAFTRCVATGLRLTALLFFSMEFFRHVCRRHGLADAHFNWPQTSLSILSRNMRWLMPSVLPVAFIVSALEYHSVDAHRDTLGRLAFTVGLAALAVFMHRVLRPRRGALAETYLRYPQRWTTRLQRSWHWLGVGAPMALAALASSGYYYTAVQLTWRLMATIWLIVGLLILAAVFVRWVQMTRRAIAIRQAAERRAAQSAKSDGAAAVEPAPLVQPAPLDLSFLSEQARRLLQSAVAAAALVGVWLIWVDVLPALRVLDNVTLWTVGGETSVLAALPTPASAAGAPDATKEAGNSVAEASPSVTLADLLKAVLLASMTVIAARNIPGLLEFTLLQRLPVESGAKFAVKTVASYLITVVGVVSSLKTLGVAWVHVQWLVAAISVGLGFGLQEIFGNFVSGLIILFERPIRVGDIVTVGQLTGCVSRIQIRATTISDGDRRELIVPNKDFITGQIVNWTLTDPVTRVVVPVGIAYDADVELAHRLLLDAARENPWVMREPAPMAVLTNLGENALQFELRVFIANRENHAALVHTLNATIARVFRNHGIEIAYPQRDVRIRGVDAASLAFPGALEARRAERAAA